MSADLFLTDCAFVNQKDNGRLKSLNKGRRVKTMRLDEFLDCIDNGQCFVSTIRTKSRYDAFVHKDNQA